MTHQGIVSILRRGAAPIQDRSDRSVGEVLLLFVASTGRKSDDWTFPGEWPEWLRPRMGLEKW